MVEDIIFAVGMPWGQEGHGFQRGDVENTVKYVGVGGKALLLGLAS